MQTLVNFCVKHPKTVMGVVLSLTITLILLVAIPSLYPGALPGLPGISIDTDPENMLPADEPVRVFHNEQKKRFSLYDMIVVGVVNEQHKNGVFNADTLRRVYELTAFAKDLEWQDKDGKDAGVIKAELMAPSTVDNIEQAGLGAVRFEWLMPKAPENDKEALTIRNKALNLPMLKGSLVSDAGDALALYIPISAKNVSYQVAEKLREKIKGFGAIDEVYYITGLPIAQDTFGVEMFMQMAVSAPMAMLLIFLLLLFFFRKLVLIISPLLVAMAAVISTMGLLIISGNTVHIMSSMIPIFIMPIAVLDAVHLLSDFFDRYQKTKDRIGTIKHVMHDLWSPMLYTSLTTCAGFGSLALTPNPPVQVFGIFVAIGVFFAWLFTVTMIPAYIALLSESSLSNFGLSHSDEQEHLSLMGKALKAIGSFTYSKAKAVILLIFIFGAIAYYGIAQIQINDNPVKWFTKSHEIRVADKALNKRFAGTYMAYLMLEPASPPLAQPDFEKALITKLETSSNTALNEIAAAYRLEDNAPQMQSKEEFVDYLREIGLMLQDKAPDEKWDSYDEALNFLDQELLDDQVFKKPEILRYIDKLQAYLLKTGLVGKSNSLADIVKTVHRELLLGEEKEYRIPDSVAAVGQTLVSYQSGHRPNDLWHFVSPDYRKNSIWIQLKSGDNKDMSALVKAVDKFFKSQPAPVALKHNWYGLTYINVVWQQKMVSGMLEAFLGSFVIVFILMALLFRSALWGALSMIPLTITIGMIYGAIGLVGKDYDMPVAVLSSLSLGLAVDYAIHFLARSRELRKRFSSWKETNPAVFGEPARAIARNIIVVGVGFLPLLAAPLVPYKTVGAFISAILVLAGVATLTVLPALIKLLEHRLFKQMENK